MTEAEWLESEDSEAMLKVICRSADERKLRLFALACCRRVEFLLGADDVKRCRKAIGVLESRVEGLASEDDLRTALVDMVGESMDAGHSIAHPGEADLYAISFATGALENVRRGEWVGVADLASIAIAYDALSQSGNPDLARIAAPWKTKNYWSGELQWHQDEVAVLELPEFVSAWGTERRNQTRLLRDIFGNLFRPITFATAWRTSDVMLLAWGIYDERAFDRMPILADALQDAGCDSDDILNHLRDPHATHVRGCWALDLVLGKE